MENTPDDTFVKAADYFCFVELLKIQKEEELIRLAYRARKANKPWLSELLLRELKDRTSQ